MHDCGFFVSLMLHMCSSNGGRTSPGNANSNIVLPVVKIGAAVLQTGFQGVLISLFRDTTSSLTRSNIVIEYFLLKNLSYGHYGQSSWAATCTALGGSCQPVRELPHPWPYLANLMYNSFLKQPQWKWLSVFVYRLYTLHVSQVYRRVFRNTVSQNFNLADSFLRSCPKLKN